MQIFYQNLFIIECAKKNLANIPESRSHGFLLNVENLQLKITIDWIWIAWCIDIFPNYLHIINQLKKAI